MKNHSQPTTTRRGRKKPFAQRAERRGAALVEFAVVAPLLILLAFGMLEYGRAVMSAQILTNAAREGCRRAVLDGVTNDEVTDTVTEYLGDASIPTSGSLDVDILNSAGTALDLSTAAPGIPVTVTVSVDFSDVSWLPSPLYLGGQTLSASCTMRRETAQ